MKVTATRLVTFFTCPFLEYVSYRVREPLRVWGAARRFGTVIHAAIAEYERHGRSLRRGLLVLEEELRGLPAADLEEARSILVSRHERASGREGRAVLVEGSLRAHLDGERLELRMDRLDRVGPDFLLVELKGGRTVDLELVRAQLRVLSYGVLDVLGRAPSAWEVELLRAGKILRLPAEQDPSRLRDFALGLLRGLRDGESEPRPYDPAFCRRCPARFFCPRASERPRPFTRVPEPRRETQLFLFEPRATGPNPKP